MKKKIITFILAATMLVAFGSTSMAAADDWKVLNGYGTVPNTGKGLSEEPGGIIVLNGYGNLSYQPKVVKEAVAVEFQVTAYPTTTHYFSIGLLDTPNALWNTSGTLSKGIMTRISVSTDGNTLRAGGLNITGGPVQSIDAPVSDLKAVQMIHTLAMYKEGNNWIYTLDGKEAMEIPISSAKLGSISYLSVGSYGSSTMEIVINKVYVDDEVTTEIKNGTYVKELAGDEALSKIYYDDNDRLIIGEVVKDSALSYTEPTNINVNMSEEPQEPAYMTYILLGAASVTLILSVLMFVLEGKRAKKNAGKKEIGKEVELLEDDK